MIKIRLLSLILILFLSILNAQEKKPTLIFYCGITMVKPIKEMAKIIEDKYNVTIKISQGGSKDLYDSLKYSRLGDLYLPGSKSYRVSNLKDNLLLDAVTIGYNKAAIFVQKGNPQNIKSMDDFLNEEYSTILCNPKSGSIGKMTKKIFNTYKGQEFFENAYDNSTEIGTDSRNLNRALIEKRADLTVNWRATSYWPENKKYIDIIEIDDKYAPKKELVISLLSFSENKEVAKAFMEFAKSKEGQKIMKKYGFL